MFLDVPTHGDDTDHNDLSSTQKMLCGIGSKAVTLDSSMIEWVGQLPKCDTY